MPLGFREGRRPGHVDRAPAHVTEWADMTAPSGIDAEYLAPNAHVDSDHPEVVAYAERHRAGSDIASAVALYYAIRDGFRYTPWGVSTDAEAFRASEVAGRTFERGGHCIDKALLLAGCARALGIPSRLHFANVRNHIGTAKLEEKLGTDLLVFHGYAELWLEGRWVAATPAFNRELCERLNVLPLEWDGRTDAILQAFSPAGARFMEYVHDYGTFPTVPHALMVAEWKKHYPTMRNGVWPTP
ncbi:MAG: transglutaminase protein [Myxococcaceae bacterium]|nr:transglutaminase protein [Myxococcaceae bacterium]